METGKTVKNKNCDDCKRLEDLKAENETLRKERELSFLLLDVILIAIEHWGKQHGLLQSEENFNKGFPDWDNQVRMLLNQFREAGKETMRNRFLAILEAIESGK